MCELFSSTYKLNRSSVSLCDRLKQRYGNCQQNLQALFHDEIPKKNIRDIEFIRYIVNYIIEQAKHNIVISELPDVIRTLHNEVKDIIQKNKMITLEEAIAHVQQVGAMKYPYLKKLKPISTEDFVNEVMREVFNRLGTIITLDMIENICRFTTCSTKQLLHAMPTIDVHEAATLIMEDISRNQYKIKKNQKQINVVDNTVLLNHTIKDKTISLSPKHTYEKSKSASSSLSKEHMKPEWKSSKLIQNSNKSHSKTKLTEHRNLSLTKKKSKSSKSSSTSYQSSKKSNKNQQNWSSNQIDSTKNHLLKFKKSKSHFAEMFLKNPFVTMRQNKSMKKPKSTNVSSSSLVSFDTYSTEICPLAEIEQKFNPILESQRLIKKPEQNKRKSIMTSIVQEQVKNQNQEIIDPLTVGI
ncbi:unnamed protein product [Rotaria sordida]|uniref:Uncharacterized protein n=1 Tax=Rotaria sordida TaxID=392033 RepID=A0A818RLM2_9BILA|nr:unnamed protein product [Rotaria sordida]CAF3659747.1 unnamed protein product [Rotaria sordida]